MFGTSVTKGSKGSATSSQTAGDIEAREREMFTVLSNARRLSVLRYLLEIDGSTDLETLIQVVAAEEFGVPVSDLDRKEERRVYVALHQNHLPYLEEKGLVEWDRSRGTVSLQRSELLERILGEQPESSARSFNSPLFLSVCSVGMVVAYLAGVVDLTVGSMSGPLSLLAGAILLAAGTTWLVEQRF